MNATCYPTTRSTTQNTTTASPSCGVDENLQKPRYTVRSSAEAHEIRVELPGVPKSDVKIDLDQNILTVQTEGRNAVPETWMPLHRELSTADYLLRLRLHAPADADRLKATLENGILTLHLPIAEEAKPRQIAVE